LLSVRDGLAENGPSRPDNDPKRKFVALQSGPWAEKKSWRETGARERETAPIGVRAKPVLGGSHHERRLAPASA